MKLSYKLSKTADAAQFYMLQQALFDVQAALKKMATSVSQHERQHCQLKGVTDRT